MQNNLKSIFSGLLKAGFSLGLLAWLIASGKLDLGLLSGLLNIQSVFIGVLFIGGSNFLVSERWRTICQSQDLQINSFDAFKLSLIGVFFNFAVPGGVGGDFIKGWYFAKQNPDAKMLSATTVLMDRVLGLYAMIIMALLAMCFDVHHVLKIETLTHLFYMIIGFFIISSVGLTLLFRGLLNKLPIGGRLQNLIQHAAEIGKYPKVILKTFIQSLLAQSLSICFLYFAGSQMLSLDVNLHTYFLVAPLGFMATAIPVSPGGIGVGQAAFFYLFNLYLGSESPLGSTVLTALQGAQLVFGLGGAYFYMRIKKDQLSGK